VTTIALVQGRALGGGFETALSADFIIAEEQSTFGFPEIIFGLFPCTGGMSLLARRVGVYQAEKMLTNERIYKAHELLEMGVVDEVCAQGEGEIAVEKFIAKHGRRRGSRMMLQRARHRLAPLNYEELHTVVEEWVELAMRLSPGELRMMEMLSMMQQGAQSA
jgi:DSF synthase